MTKAAATRMASSAPKTPAAVDPAAIEETLRMLRAWKQDAAAPAVGDNIEPLRTLGIPEWAIGDLRLLGATSGKSGCDVARTVLVGALWDFRQERRRAAQ